MGIYVLRNILMATIKECDFSTFDRLAVLRELNIHSGSFNNAKQFSIDVPLKTFNR